MRAPHLAQGGVLHCNLAEEKVDVVPVLDGMEKMGFCRTQRDSDAIPGGAPQPR